MHETKKTVCANNTAFSQAQRHFKSHRSNNSWCLQERSDYIQTQGDFSNSKNTDREEAAQGVRDSHFEMT